MTVSINQFYSNDDFDMFTQVSDSEPHGFLLTPTMRRGGGLGEWRFASLHFCGDWCQDCYVLSRFTIMGIPWTKREMVSLLFALLFVALLRTYGLLALPLGDVVGPCFHISIGAFSIVFCKNLSVPADSY